MELVSQVLDSYRWLVATAVGMQIQSIVITRKTSAGQCCFVLCSLVAIISASLFLSTCYIACEMLICPFIQQHISGVSV